MTAYQDIIAERNNSMRTSGILLPIFSLPSGYGIGDLSSEAYNFIDRLHEAGQRFWQVLPIGPINKEFCPYQSSSGFAGEPLLLSPEIMKEKGLLSEEDIAEAAICAAQEEKIKQKRQLLKKAFCAFRGSLADDGKERLRFQEFCREEDEWLDDFALFSALAERFDSGDWSCWEDGIKSRNAAAVEAWSSELSDEIEYYRWTQYEFFDEWNRLKEYAHAKSIELIGDIPYYAAFESADTWAFPELFRLGMDGGEVFEAGAPPDAFTEKGQCWGNPVYNWDAHKAQDYDWWIRRIEQQFRFFDVVRIDHMRGFESFYAIPGDTEDPREGHWEKGPGMELFRAVQERLGDCRFIAEDLGYLTEEVKSMLAEAGYPGMKILQFAFDTSEENVYLPFNYDTDHSVIYTGTHDNDTTLGWYEKAEDWKQRFVSWYLREKSEIPDLPADEIMEPEDAVRGLVELAHSSRCETCIIPMQDYLMLGSEARINVPGTAKGNWRWQMEGDAFNQKLAASIAEVTARYGR